MNTHITPAQPPASKNAPDNAQVGLVFIEFGVISSKHCSGLAASGMMKPNYESGQLLLPQILIAYCWSNLTKRGAKPRPKKY